MTAQPKHGHDGNVPEFMPTRDLESVDRWTGQRRREVVEGPTNINVDRIEWLFAHKVIEQQHHQAARRLQRDWEVGLIMPYAQMGTVGGGSGRADFTPAQIKIDSLDRFHDAMKAMGSKGSKIVDLVALQAMSVQKAAASMRVHQQRAQGMLLVALDVLDNHYAEMDRHGRR